MPRQSIDSFWREHVRAITANNPKWGPNRVERELQAIGAAAERRDWPSARTIGRMQAEFRQMPKPEQAAYFAFRWPEAMERNAMTCRGKQVRWRWMRCANCTPGPLTSGRSCYEERAPRSRRCGGSGACRWHALTPTSALACFGRLRSHKQAPMHGTDGTRSLDGRRERLRR
jgi:hypothetical protein